MSATATTSSSTAGYSANNKGAAVILCTAGYDRTIRFWEALSGICSRTIQHPDSQVNRLAISADKRYLASAGNPHARIYDALSSNSNVLYSLEGHTANITSIQFQQHNQWLVTGSEDGTVKIWDMRAKGPQREFHHKCSVNDLIIHPNQAEIIAVDQQGSVKVWDLTGTGGCSHELVPEEDAPMRSLSCNADGSLLLAGNNKGNVYLWQMERRTITASDPIELNSGTVAAHDWDIQPLTKTSAHSDYLLRSVLSADGRMIATASADSTIKIWKITQASVQNGLAIPEVTLDKTLIGHQRWVWDCAFSADSEYLVSASSDHTARLWDLARGETIRQYQGHHKATVCVALNDYSSS